MIANFLRFIRFSHTIFALPFALGSLLVAADGRPPPRLLGLVVLAMVFARTAAMTFNRIADWEIDKRNPRTEGRHKLISKSAAITACAASSAAFLGVCALINPLCFALSPLALAVLLGYSLTKRFTRFAQFALGLALAIAPVGAWLAVRGAWDPAPIILAGAVLAWVAGFDIIYATQDIEADLREGLHSMVVWLGLPKALSTAALLHTAAWMGFVAFGVATSLGPAYFVACAGMLAGLIIEQRLARTGNIPAINKAFFQVNAAVGVIFVAGVIGGLFR